MDIPCHVSEPNSMATAEMDVVVQRLVAFLSCTQQVSKYRIHSSCSRIVNIRAGSCCLTSLMQFYLPNQMPGARMAVALPIYVYVFFKSKCWVRHVERSIEGTGARAIALRGQATTLADASDFTFVLV